MLEPRCGVVVISYGNRPIRSELITAIAGMQTVVVRNPNGDAMTANDPPTTGTKSTVMLPTNRGYASAVNVGIRALLDSPEDAIIEFVFVLTDDLGIDAAGIDSLIRHMEDDKSIGAIGPALDVGDPPQRRFGGTLLATGFHDRWSLFAPVHPRHNFAVPNQHEASPIVNVDWFDGSCMLLRVAALRSLEGFGTTGVLDEGTFMYVDEVDLHDRLHAKDWTVAVATDVVATQTSGMNQRPGAHGYLIVRNTIRLARRRDGLLRVLTTAAIGGVSALKQFITALTSTAGYGRAHHARQAIGMVWGVAHGLLGYQGAPPKRLRNWGDIRGVNLEPYRAPRSHALASNGIRHGKSGPILLWFWGRRGGGVGYSAELARALRELGEEVIETTERRPWRLLLSALPGPWSLGHFANQQNVRAVIHTMPHPFSLPAAQRVRRPNIPLIVVAHDANPHPGEPKKLLWKSIRAMWARATAIVALSEHVASDLRATGIDQTKPIAIIPHGPLHAINSPSDPKLTQLVGPAPSVLFFGRLLEYKGIDLLLKAWPLVIKRVPSAHLHIAGEGPLSAELRKQQQSGMLATSISLDLRWIPDEEIPKLLENARVLAVPYTEASQSGVIPSARTFGLPVVATNVGGLCEQVTDNVDGLLTEKNPNAFADAVIRTLTDDQLWRRLSTATRSQESWPTIARAYLDFITTLTNSAAPTVPTADDPAKEAKTKAAKAKETKTNPAGDRS